MDGSRKRIREIEAEQQVLRRTMADQASAWQTAAARWLQAEWDATARHAVSDAPDHAKELAASGKLTQLKAEVEDLKGQAEELLSEAFDQADDVWSHIKGVAFDASSHPPYRSKSVYQFYGNRPPEVFDEHLRLLKGRVFTLLVDAGLVRPRAEMTRHGDSFRYAYGYDWSSEMRDRIGEYSATYRTFVALVDELDALRSQIARSEATALWDQA